MEMLEHPAVTRAQRTGYGYDYETQPGSELCDFCQTEIEEGDHIYMCEGSQVCSECYKEYAMDKLDELGADELAGILGDSWEVV